MSDRFSFSDCQIIDRDARNMAAAGIALSTELNAIWAAIDTGNIGIQSDAADVDAICEGGGVVGQDVDTTSGTTFGYFGGRVLFGQTTVTVAAGTLALTPSAVNYVEVDSAGVVSTHTSPASFTAGKVPLYKITVGTSSISLVENYRVLLVGFADQGIVGAWVSDAVRTHSIDIPLGAVTATTSWAVISPAYAGTLTKASITVVTTHATNDSDYWTFSLVNKGPSGSGTTDMLSTADANTTKATGGSAITAYVKRNLTLHGTPANLDHAAEDVLVFTATKSGSAVSLAGAVARLDFTSEL